MKWLKDDVLTYLDEALRFIDSSRGEDLVGEKLPFARSWVRKALDFFRSRTMKTKKNGEIFFYIGSRLVNATEWHKSPTFTSWIAGILRQDGRIRKES